MTRIPQRFIDDLLDRIDIVDVISARIALRKAGKNYSARCPFHDEKTPSFSVSPDKQFYYCFGCGAAGNAIGFVMDHDHLSFPQAVDALASQCGMVVPREESQESAAQSRRGKLYALLADADRFYRQQLRQHGDAKIAVNYLKKRGLSGEIASKFGIGYAPQGWDNLLNRLCDNDSDIELLVEAGLVVRRDDASDRTYDRFRHRIIFPIRDTRGRTIGFGGRVLDDSKPKYLNSPETPVFHKGRELYGLYEAHKTLGEIRSLLVVEGYMDVVALAQHGIHNAVATLGTAATADHLEKLFRYTSDVIFCFDGDEAGARAARRAMETCLPVMADGRSARFLFLPSGEDPDTLVRKLGSEGFSKIMERAQPLSDFLFTCLEEGLNTGSIDGKARLSQLAAPLINRIPDGVFRQLMLKELARRTDMDIDALAAIIAPPAEKPTLPREENPLLDQGDAPIPHETAPRDDRHYQRNAHIPTESAADTQPQRRLRLTPLQRLILLLLHAPQLRCELTNVQDLLHLDDPDAATLVNLCSLLDEQPHYTLNHILGYWRGIYGAVEGERLARIVAADMLGAAQHSARDDVTEFRDIYRHLQEKLFTKRPAKARLEELLAREELSPEERKQATLLWHQELSDEERTPALYQLMKQKLIAKTQAKK